MNTAAPYAQLTVADFLAQLAAQTPTPGGGSVAALAGALAASLGRMVVSFTVGRPKFAAAEPELREIDARLERAAAMLQQLMDEDAAAYELLSAAFKLPKTEAGRAEQIEKAAAVAARVPLETAMLAARVRTDAQRLCQIGNPNLGSDAQAAVHLSGAAISAAAANVRANLPFVPQTDRAGLDAQLGRLGVPA